MENSIKIKDISNHWARQSIEYLIENKIITGYPIGMFNPEDFVTRAEFVAMVAKLLKLPLDSENGFRDVKSHWAGDYISAVVKAGLIKGISGADFEPNFRLSKFIESR